MRYGMDYRDRELSGSNWQRGVGRGYMDEGSGVGRRGGRPRDRGESYQGSTLARGWGYREDEPLARGFRDRGMRGYDRGFEDRGMMRSGGGYGGGRERITYEAGDRGYRGGYDRDMDVTDRIEQGWDRLKQGARNLTGRGYDRGW